MKGSIVMLALAATGYASPQETLRPGGLPGLQPEQVVVAKLEPGPACSALGPSEATDVAFGIPRCEAVVAKVQKKAAGLDALRSPGPNGLPLSGRAFACPADAIPGREQTKQCEPDCSPGHTCLRGQRASACTPACEAGRRCGADRTCHLVQ